MFHVMNKPGGPACNMACEYCFYRHNQPVGWVGMPRPTLDAEKDAEKVTSHIS